ncbi:RSL1D1 [Bugula neritina]|uniref:Ribosomal L1 domain-containing protein 1 n=1 Tax=Bugula neritina TaxID=10212 RepID=A0A7J7JXT8_BUGNE|nr:RSL1D1 [Bugula neritina]
MAEICDQVPDKQIIKALKVFRDLDAKKDKMSLMSSNDIRLSFSFFKLPSQASKNSKMLKIALPHPLGFEDVCLFVGDGPEAKDDRTKMDDVCQLYENKLAKLGITQVKEIIPMLKLKLEYQTYEARRALASRYDCFLADDKIMRLLPSLLGKSFFQQNKFPLQVRLRESCMERELKKALHTVTCPITYKGNSYSVVVGNLEMKDEELAQNIRSAMLKIAENGLGGPQNIQKFHLNLNNLPSLPVFVSNVDRSAVPIPMPHKQSVSKPTPKVEEVSTIDGKVKIGEDGTVSIYQKNGKVSHIIGGGQDSKKVKRLKKGAKPLKTDGRTKQRKVAKGAASPSQAKQVKTALKPADSDSPLNAESKQKKSATPKASDTVVLPKSAKKLNSNAGSPSVEVEKDAAKASKASPLAQKVTASELVEGDAEMSIKASPVLNASGVSKSTPKPKSAKKIKPTTASKLKPVSSNADANSATPKSIVTSADEVTKLSKSTPKPAKTPKSAITPKGVSSPKTEDMKQVKTALKQAASDSPLNAESKQKKSATPKASEQWWRQNQQRN